MNVIIIDDDAAFVSSAQLLLRSMGHEVFSFVDPDEAGFFLKMRTPFDVLILDYYLSDVTGPEILEELRDYIPQDCKVILVSGLKDSVGPLDLETIGVSEFLAKPVDFDKFCECVDGKDEKPLGTG